MIRKRAQAAGQVNKARFWQSIGILFGLALGTMLLVWDAVPSHAGIKIVKAWYAPGADGSAVTHVRLAAMIGPDGSSGAGPATFTSEIVYPGTLTSAVQHGGEIVNNARHSIVAINFTPCTEVTDLYLIVQSSSGQVTIINNVNERVADLCARIHKVFNGDDTRAQEIDGDKLYLVAQVQGVVAHYYYVTLRVSPSGHLALLNYSAQIVHG